MTSRLRAPERHSYGMHFTAGFDELIRRLIKGPSEREAIESGQIDAIVDPATGRAILLPEAQEALREDHARDRSLVRLSSDWRWEQDKDYRFVAWEGATNEPSAFQGETLIGKRLWDLPFENMSEVDWRAHCRQLERHTAYRDLELRFRDHSGALRYFSISGEPIFDAQGRFKGYRGTARDISKLKLADAALRNPPGIAPAALDALAAEICVLDATGTIILANRAWRAFATAKGCSGIGIPQGANYLTVCDVAPEEERVNSTAIAAGIRQVIAGKCGLFRHEYSGNWPSGRFGFVLTATGFPLDGAACVVISHEKTGEALEQTPGHERAEQLPELDYPVADRASVANCGSILNSARISNNAPPATSARRALITKGAASAKGAIMANSVLAAMPHKEYERLVAGLELVSLTFGDVLFEPGDSIRYIYFPSDCLISLLTQVEDHMTLEVGLVGSEGMVGIPLALGVGTSSVRALVQGTGAAMRMEAGRFQLEFKQSPSLQRELYRYAHLLMAQFTQTAACNRFHVVEARLARWLSMTRDRVRSNQFQLTHEFLADILGVRRVGVTNAANALRRRKLIEYSRGNITILDRKGLNAASCGCYRIVKDLFDEAQRQPVSARSW